MSKTYSESLAELEQILAKLRSDNCDVDRLTELTKRAAELLKACRAHLTVTESELSEILSGLESDATQA